MREYNYRLLVSVCLIHFLLGFDINIISVSLPSISEYFSVNPGTVNRIIWIYFLVIVCLLLATGKAGDIKGFKKIYTSGIILFIAGSLLASVSFDFNFLLLSRIVQAAGAAAMFALTPAIITFYFPEEVRGRVFGINYSFTALGGITGRAASGFLVSNLGWNSVFYLNIPFGLLALILIYRYLPEFVPTGEKKRFDFKNALLISSGLFFLMTALNTGNQSGWTSVPVLLSFTASAVLILLFYNVQMKSENPLIDKLIIKNKRISFPVIAFALVYLITNGMIFLVPFFLQWVKLISKQEAGLLMAVPSVMQMIAGYISGKLSDSYGKSKICLYALVFIFVSLILHLMFTPESSMYFIIITLAFYGAAIGFFIPSNTNAIMTNAPEISKGTVSGFMTTFIRIGSAFGTVIFGSLFSHYVPFPDPLKSQVSKELIVSGFRGAVFAGIVSALISMLLIYYSESRNRTGLIKTQRLA